ncbi:MAG: ribulokinase [Pirellulaceae bacterium]|nr:ribulokinase [Pirellulaceae bacterium]
MYSLGVDYGTNSVRALIVDTSNGVEIATHVYDYPSGDAGILVDPDNPNLARQNPADYIDGFHQSVRGAVKAAESVDGFSADQIVGIGIDTTGSTPIPVDQTGQPLAFDPQFKDNLAAQAWLWKDHTSHAEADEITQTARYRGEPYLAKCGGAYSSEWYWSIILHCMRTAPDVAAACASWVECADFIPAYATGNTDPKSIKRSICAAGHKAMYNADWGGLPSVGFLESLQTGLSRFRYQSPAVAVDQIAGHLSQEVAQQVGLPEGIPVAVGAFDAHLGAVGSGCREGTLVKIIGTSTCDCMVAPLATPLPDVPGLCGIVPESILPGMYGLEAGQSAVGDIFSWFVRHICSGPDSDLDSDPDAAERDAAQQDAVHHELTQQAAKLRPGQSGLIALDWNNGNRTILADPRLTGLLVGQTLHTRREEIYRALIEATAFGARTIIGRMQEYGVQINEVVNCGGIAEKNPLVMQIYADVCNRPMKISRSAQSCALGASICGAVVGGAHSTFQSAQESMTGVKDTVFEPITENVEIYERLYAIYRRLHDAFGIASDLESMASVMKDLIAIRDRVRHE